ncbi:hypothetical protein B0H13DRAFT_1902497 [Mycena leptocephala]|nr:hypothetical protein B0H13DRAFT_1902497 [Mycena leptocephala]
MASNPFETLISDAAKTIFQRRTQLPDGSTFHLSNMVKASVGSAGQPGIKWTSNSHATAQEIVFEIAALSHPIDIPNLMLIAWRIREWVEPLLYRVVLVGSLKPHIISGFPVFTADILLRVIASKPPGFLQNAVRHLFFDGEAGEQSEQSEVEAILAACNRVTNLYDNFQFIVNEDEDVCTRLALIPHLTHISFYSAPFENTVFHAALHADTRLHCFVFFESKTVHLEYIDEAGPLLGDDRLVCMEQEEDFRVDWLRGAHTGYDYWALAEAFIAAKRAGKVDPFLDEALAISDRDGEWWNNE